MISWLTAVTVWAAGLTVKPWSTGVAASNVASPSWVASMVQVPWWTMVTVAVVGSAVNASGATVQTPVVRLVNVISSAASVLALIPNGAAP